MKFLYMLVIWFIITTLLYFMISVYSRSVRREKLEKQWAEDHQGGDSEARTTYIENGMVEYEHGFRKKLIVLVYIVPVVLVTAILYLTN